jgi:predicted amidophosphoribosyltransferase
MPSEVHVLGDYWREGVDEPTELGELIASAKDLGSAEALSRLREMLFDFVGTLDLPETCLVVAVPPGPEREAHPVPSLATAVGSGLGADVVAVIERRDATARLRDTPPDRRRAVVEAARYEIVGDVRGRHVVLVDDVILTGTTLRHLAGLLVAAGAERVDAVVAGRTRLS